MKLEKPNMPKLPKLPKLTRGGGPKVEMPNVEVPKVVRDVFDDLKDRHLLPLVAVLAIAIPAVPFLLSSSEPALTPSTGQAGLPAPAAGSSAARLTVVSDNPGLRDYRRRLGRLQAKNPFQAHFTAPRVGGANLGSGATTTVPTTGGGAVTSTSTTTSSTTVTGGSGDLPPASGGGGGNGGGNGGGPPKVKVETKYVSYEVDVRAGVPGKTKPRHGVHELQMLPNEKNPIAVFMGISGDGKRAMFLVTSEVTSTFGDVKCGFGDSSCQLVELTPGLPVTFVYGENDKRYQINVVKIHRLVRDPGAGKPRPKGQGNRSPKPRIGLSDAG